MRAERSRSGVERGWARRRRYGSGLGHTVNECSREFATFAASIPKAGVCERDGDRNMANPAAFAESISDKMPQKSHTRVLTSVIRVSFALEWAYGYHNEAL